MNTNFSYFAFSESTSVRLDMMMYMEPALSRNMSALSRMGRTVTCCDISQKALECTEKNAIRNRVSLTILNSSLFSNIDGKFDTIIFNPPYLPVEDRIEGAEQWNGGTDGFSVIGPFLDKADLFLDNAGSIYIIISSLTDIDALKTKYEKFVFKEKASESFFFETLFLYQLFMKV